MRMQRTDYRRVVDLEESRDDSALRHKTQLDHPRANGVVQNALAALFSMTSALEGGF